MAIVDQIWKKRLNEDSCVKKNSIHKLFWFLLQTFREFFWVVESEHILAQIVHWFRGETLAHQVDHGKALHDLRLSLNGPPFTQDAALPVSQTKKGAAATRWHCTSDSVKPFESMQRCIFLLLHWLYPKQCFTADDGSIRQNLRDVVISQRYHQTRHLTR